MDICLHNASLCRYDLYAQRVGVLCRRTCKKRIGRELLQLNVLFEEWGFGISLYERESLIEKHLVAEVKKAGGVAFKFVSPGHRSVPDRIVLLPGGSIFSG